MRAAIGGGDTSQSVPSMVIGLLVLDPRLMMPKKKAFNQVNDESERQRFAGAAIGEGQEKNQGEHLIQST